MDITKEFCQGTLNDSILQFSLKMADSWAAFKTQESAKKEVCSSYKHR